MSDDERRDETSDEAPAETPGDTLAETPGDGTDRAQLEAGGIAPNPVRDRLLLPLLLPILALIAVALYVLNLSRVFLAGGTGPAPVIVAAIVTVTILAGAAILSALPRLRTSTLTMTVTMLVVIIMGAGLITLGPSEDHHDDEAAGYQEPEGDPNSTLEVDALAALSFQEDEFTVEGGILQLDYVGKGGFHTLLFDEQEFAGFGLAVSGSETDSGKVEIGEGEYTIYCDVPGHRAAGMEATLVVTPPPPGAEPGTEEEPDAGGEAAP